MHQKAASTFVAQGSKTTLKVWHNRLAHANYESVKEIAKKGLAKGFDMVAGDGEKDVCVACVKGKMARKPFGNRTSPLAKEPLALVHMDVCGPMRCASKGGARFLLVMLDDATRMCWTRLLKAKGDAATEIQKWALLVCDGDKKRMKSIRTDGSGEFMNTALEKSMTGKGIWHDVSTPYIPQQNGVAERLNRTLMEAVRSLLQHSKLGDEWWGEMSALAAWVLWDLDEKRVFTSHDVVFEEDKFPLKGKLAPQLTFVLPAREEHEAMEIPPQAEKEAKNGGGESNEESDDEVVEELPTATATSSTPSPPPLALTRERREPHPNRKYDDYATVAVGKADEESVAFFFATMGDDNPCTHKEALASPDAPPWKQAMEKELASIKENDVFELVDPPKGAYFVGSKRVLKKLGANGSVERYKERLVAQGYTQWEGEHYSESFAPVSKASTLRVLLALAASLNLEVEQLDVCTAFIYGLLLEEVYMRQPPGYDDGSGKVWKINRTLYGLKQSPRGWYTCIDEFLLQHSFTRSECDSALYVLKEGEKQSVLLL
ncbi:unnamed protein product [Closterium sp. NIES-54]